MSIVRFPSFVIVLFLAFVGPGIGADPALASNESGPPAGVSIDTLISGVATDEDLPPVVDTLALSRVTLAPGSKASATNGTHLFFVESGTLTVDLFGDACPRIAGRPGQGEDGYRDDDRVDLGRGSELTIACPVGTSPAITNDGNTAAIALVVSIVQTDSTGIDGSLRGWSTIVPLAAAATATDLPSLSPRSTMWTEPTVVSLHRVRLAKGVGLGAGGDLTNDAMIELASLIPETGARLLAVESGAMNYLFTDAAVYQRAGGTPERIPAHARSSQMPGDSVFILPPGQTLIRNVGRGPSSDLLVVTVGIAQDDFV